MRATSVVAAAGIAAMLVTTYAVRRPDSGIAVRAVALDDPVRPLRVAVRIRKFGERAVLASGRTGPDGRTRFVLEQGRYTVEAEPRRGRSDPRPLSVFVPEADLTSVELRYGPRRRARP